MRRCPLLALIAVVLFASTPMPARRSDVPPCCRGGACPMRMQEAASDCMIGGCDDQAAAKIAFAHATRITIIDASPVPPKGSRGKGLQPRTLEIFEDLGVLDELLAAGTEYPPIRISVGPVPIWQSRMHKHAEPTEDVPYPNILMVPQFRTEEILRARLAELGGQVEWGAMVVDVSDQDADGVTAVLERGDARDRVRAAYVVAADGGRSVIRKQLGIGFEGETHETERMLLGDVRVEGLAQSRWQVWVNPLRRNKFGVALCPLPGTDLFQFTAPLDAANGSRFRDEHRCPITVPIQFSKPLDDFRARIRHLHSQPSAGPAEDLS